jgi:hypothetical protein
MRALHVALLHYPVYDRHGNRVSSAVTHLDIHDIARTARTFGAQAYFLVHPVAAQRELVEHILSHWEEAPELGAHTRREALQLVRPVADLSEARQAVEHACGKSAFVVATSAVSRPGSIAIQELHARAEDRPLLVVFGTGWGLCEDIFEEFDATLEPIDAGAGYNHLPVRVAVGIVLDRLTRSGR